MDEPGLRWGTTFFRFAPVAPAGPHSCPRARLETVVDIVTEPNDRLTAHVIRVSPTSRKILGVIEHLGLEVDIEALPSFCGSTLAPDYRALNPNAKVPTLVHGDFVLWESCAIIKYLADLVPGTDLVPTDVRARADMWRWVFWEAVHFTPALARYFWQSFVKPHYALGEPDTDELDASLPEIEKLAAILDDRLRDRPFIMGDTPTLADYAVGSTSAHQRRGAVPLERFANLRAWYDRLEALPAWRRTLPPFDAERRT